MPYLTQKSYLATSIQICQEIHKDWKEFYHQSPIQFQKLLKLQFKKTKQN